MVDQPVERADEVARAAADHRVGREAHRHRGGRGPRGGPRTSRARSVAGQVAVGERTAQRRRCPRSRAPSGTARPRRRRGSRWARLRRRPPRSRRRACATRAPRAAARATLAVVDGLARRAARPRRSRRARPGRADDERGVRRDPRGRGGDLALEQVRDEPRDAGRGAIEVSVSAARSAGSDGDGGLERGQLVGDHAQRGRRRAPSSTAASYPRSDGFIVVCPAPLRDFVVAAPRSPRR